MKENKTHENEVQEKENYENKTHENETKENPKKNIKNIADESKSGEGGQDGKNKGEEKQKKAKTDKEGNPVVPFWVELKRSIFNFDAYHIFVTAGWKRGIIYLLKLVCLYTVVFSVVVTGFLLSKIPQGVADFKEYVPNFSYSQNTLQANENNEATYPNFAGEGTFLVVNTGELSQEKLEEYENKIKLYSLGILVTKNNIFIKNSTIGSDVQQESLEKYIGKLNSGDFTKQDLVNKLDKLNYAGIAVCIFMVAFVTMYIVMLFTLIMDLIILTLMVNILAFIFGMRAKVEGSFGIAVHATTLSVILLLIYSIANLLTGFTIKYFNVMYDGISYVYAITALILIRQLLIKQKNEIGKIVKDLKQDLTDSLKPKDKSDDIDENADDHVKVNDSEKKGESEENKSNNNDNDNGKNKDEKLANNAINNFKG